VVTVTRDSEVVAVMRPQKRTYLRGQVQTESAVNAGIFRDLYVALGEPMNANDIEGAWSLRLYYKPFIRWIWGGGLLMMLGGFVCAGDKRFRIRRAAETEAATVGLQVQETNA
jgi:cytochrome c-type biogenesis protein CcmF